MVKLASVSSMWIGLGSPSRASCAASRLRNVHYLLVCIATWSALSFHSYPSMRLLFVCLAAHWSLVDGPRESWGGIVPEVVRIVVPEPFSDIAARNVRFMPPSPPFVSGAVGVPRLI